MKRILLIFGFLALMLFAGCSNSERYEIYLYDEGISIFPQEISYFGNENNPDNMGYNDVYLLRIVAKGNTQINFYDKDVSAQIKKISDQYNYDPNAMVGCVWEILSSDYNKNLANVESFETVLKLRCNNPDIKGFKIEAYDMHEKDLGDIVEYNLEVTAPSEQMQNIINSYKLEEKQNSNQNTIEDEIMQQVEENREQTGELTMVDVNSFIDSCVNDESIFDACVDYSNFRYEESSCDSDRKLEYCTLQSYINYCDGGKNSMLCEGFVNSNSILSKLIQ